MNDQASATGEPTTGAERQPSETKRIWSWVATSDDRDERIEHAHQLIGLEVATIHYINLDYSRDDLAPEHLGPRQIIDAQEWQEPTWRFQDCDSVDFGVELHTSDRRVFSITWDPPGEHEGLGIREQPLLGSAIATIAGVAVWDVTKHSNWPSLTGRKVDDVTLNYEDWGEPGEGFWCPRISLRIGTTRVEFLMADGDTDGPMSPSGDNVAVTFTSSTT
jgi:hypothetical protein